MNANFAIPEEMIVAKISRGQGRPRVMNLAAKWLNNSKEIQMSRRINSLGLFAASMAACSLFLTGAATGEAAPVIVTGPAVQAGPVVAAPTVHKLHGRIVAVTAPLGSNVGPTITMELRRRQSSESAANTFVVEKKTFPIAAGAPIELIANGTKKPLTPAALTSGRRAALLVSDGVVNEVDLFAQRVPAVGYTSTMNHSYYSPYRFSATNWFGLPYHHFAGWNYFYTGSGVRYTGHVHGVRLSHRTAAGQHTRVEHRNHSVNYRRAGHSSRTGHHGRSGHGHAGRHVRTVSHRHGAGHHAGHHAHSVKHSHRGGHRHGGHHKK